MGNGTEIEKYDAIIHENNLSSIMNECLQKKLKNLHQKEILNMEKEFNYNLELVKQRVKNDLSDALNKEIENLKDEV